MNRTFVVTKTSARNVVKLSALAFALGTAVIAQGAAGPRRPAKPLLLEPKDRVLVQRAFFPFGEALRLYACVVGAPAGIHYAYDLETGALLSVWRGPFADVSELWAGRSLSQTARPAGGELALSAKPAFALFPNRLLEYPKIWPEQPLALYASQGYELEPDGQPVFLANLEYLTIRDRIAPSADGRGLTRRLEFGGELSPWETWLLLGEADAIAPLPDGSGWSAGEGGWTVEWPAGSPHQPVVRTESGRQLLALKIEPGNLAQPVAYTLTW